MRVWVSGHNNWGIYTPMLLMCRMDDSITQSRRSCVYIDTYWVMSLHIHTYILWGETRIPGDVWRLNFIDISRRETIVVPACFYMAMGFCVGACLPVWSDCPAPRGSNQAPKARAIRLWLLHTKESESRRPEWSVGCTQGKPLLNTTSPFVRAGNTQCFHGRFPLPGWITRGSTYVYIMFVHVSASFYPFWTKVPFFLSNEAMQQWLPTTDHSWDGFAWTFPDHFTNPNM